MAVDAAIITWLRKALNEVIPSGGTEADTNFTDAELTTLVEENGNNKYKAASEGWIIKAGLIQAGQVREYTIGNERYSFEEQEKAYSRALKQSEIYAQLANKKFGTRMFEAEVGDTITSETEDFSRLFGGKYDAESY